MAGEGIIIDSIKKGVTTFSRGGRRSLYTDVALNSSILLILKDLKLEKDFTSLHVFIITFIQTIQTYPIQTNPNPNHQTYQNNIQPKLPKHIQGEHQTMGIEERSLIVFQQF